MPASQRHSAGLAASSNPSRRASTDSGDSDTPPSTAQAGTRASRPSGACTHCKSLKIRCEFIPAENTCVRCKASGHDCISHGRKKRRPAPTHEDLQQRSYSQDLQIQSLLRQLDELKALSKLQQWVEQAQAEAAALRDCLPSGNAWSGMDVWGLGDSLAAPSFWSGTAAEGMPRSASPGTSALTVYSSNATTSKCPELLKCGLFGTEEVASLFQLFFAKLHPAYAILDPSLHTPQYLMQRSPFLFTVICALASRFWTERPKLHQLAMAYAMQAASQALQEGPRTVETCQAYVLMTVYPPPSERWMDDRRWLLLGMAVRIAQELTLDQPPPPHLAEVEKLNRIRTWAQVVCADASHAIQAGKPPMLRLNDYVMRSSCDWYNWSSSNLPHDVHLCAYVDVFLLVTRFLDYIRDQKLEHGLREDIDIVKTVLQYDRKIVSTASQWRQRFHENPDATNACTHRRDCGEVLTNSIRLIVLGVGFHHAAQRGTAPPADLYTMSIQAARASIQVHVSRLYPAGRLRFSVEPQFLYVAFAAAFLLNLLKPRFASLVDPSLRASIVEEVGTLIRIYRSPDVALDQRHAPAVVGRFLASLFGSVAKHQQLKEPDGQGSQQHELALAQPAPAPMVQGWPEMGPLAPEVGAYGTGAGQPGDEFSFEHFVSNVNALGTSIAGAGVDGFAPAGAMPNVLSWWNEQAFSPIQAFSPAEAFSPIEEFSFMSSMPMGM